MEGISDSTLTQPFMFGRARAPKAASTCPPWRVTGWANTRPGEQLASAVQVGRNPPASWYLAGGIRIGVQHSR